MDVRTGNIYDLSGNAEREEVESKLGRKLAPLTEKQAAELRPLSKRRRKALLAGMACPCASGKSFKKCCWRKYR